MPQTEEEEATEQTTVHRPLVRGFFFFKKKRGRFHGYVLNTYFELEFLLRHTGFSSPLSCIESFYLCPFCLVSFLVFLARVCSPTTFQSIFLVLSHRFYPRSVFL